MLCACFFVHFILGSIYTFGNYIPYIVSYTRQRSHPSDLRYGTSVWLYSISMFSQGFSAYFGGWLDRKLGPRLSTLIGSAVVVSGVLLSYFTVQHSFWLLLLTYGVIANGFGIGIAFVGPLVCAMRWFPKWKGLASGFILSGFGLSALLFNVIQTAFINPGNAKPSYAPYATDPGEKYFIDAGVLDRVPYSFLIIGVIYAVSLLIGSLLLYDPPKSQETSKQCVPEDNETAVESNKMHTAAKNTVTSKEKYNQLDALECSQLPTQDENMCEERSNTSEHSLNDEQLETEVHTSDSEDSEDSSDDKERLLSKQDSSLKGMLLSHFRKEEKDEVGLTPWQMLYKPNFYVLYFMMFLDGMSDTTIASVYKLFGISFIADDHFLTAVGSVSAIFNASGRIFWGFVADIFSHKVALVSLNGIMAAFLLTFYASTEGGEAMYFIWVCGLFFCVGGVFTIFLKAVADSFGPKHIGENYGLLYTTQMLSNVIVPILTQFLLTSLKWYGFFLLSSGFAVISYFISLVYHQEKHY